MSSLSIGTATFGNDGSWGETELGDAQRQIDLCLDHGINLIDTANVYNAGKSEEILGAALVDGRRDRLLISSKVRFPTGSGPNDRGLSRWHIIRQCEASLKRMKTDVIDIYHVHEWDGGDLLQETVEALDTLIKQGKVRYAACSNFSAWTHGEGTVHRRRGAPAAFRRPADPLHAAFARSRVRADSAGRRPGRVAADLVAARRRLAFGQVYPPQQARQRPAGHRLPRTADLRLELWTSST